MRQSTNGSRSRKGLGAFAALSAAIFVLLPSSVTPAQTFQKVADTVREDYRRMAEREVSGPALLDQIVDPETYRVGPGDEFTIQIGGATPTIHIGTISPEARVVIPMIGAVPVEGMTLAQARAEMTRLLRTYYPKADIGITLTAVRRFRVPVIGAVVRPGAQTVTASTRASEAVLGAVPESDAAERGILLLRGNDTVRVDLTRYFRLGHKDGNPYLAEGDVLLVPPRGARWPIVEVSGAVRSAGVFEFREGDVLGDLIDLAFGLTQDADTTRIELWRYSSEVNDMARHDWPAGSSISDWKRIPLAEDDHLIVRAVKDYRLSSAVTITGEVLRPGVYVFSGRQLPLTALVDSAGGFTREADLANASIVRTTFPAWEGNLRRRLEMTPEALRSQSESDLILADALSMPGRVSTDFAKLFVEGDESYDVLLSDGDRVDVPKRSAYVNVIGRVVQPGRVAYVPGGRVEYYLQSAGGYAWRANRGGTFVVKGGTGAAVKKGDVRGIEPGDMIVVPTMRDRDLWGGVKDVLAVAANLATLYLVIDQATR